MLRKQITGTCSGCNPNGPASRVMIAFDLLILGFWPCALVSGFLAAFVTIRSVRWALPMRPRRPASLSLIRRVNFGLSLGRWLLERPLCGGFSRVALTRAWL